MRRRPHSADSTMLRLWPTGSSSGLLPLIPTRWFSSSPSDPASRRTPCPPKIRRWRLQVGLSVSRLSPSCLISLSIPFHHLRPVRHYPHLWISARGLGLSGTSTHLTRQLSGTYYAEVRLLWVVHQRLRLVTSLLRTSRPQQGPWPIQRSPGSRTRRVRTCQGLRPRRVRRALAITRPPILPSVE